MKKLLVALVAALFLAASEAPRIPLRYQPEPGSTWLTEGRLRVKAVLTLPNGQENASQEEQELTWTEVVDSRDAAGTCAITRTLTRWAVVGEAESLLPREPIHFRMTRLGEQLREGLLGQPALYPARNLVAGETWPIESTHTGSLSIQGRPLPVTTHTVGTGRLVEVGPERATLELLLTVEASGQSSELASQAVTRVRWLLEIDRATGVPLSQTVETSTDQTVTLQDVSLPSHSETTLKLTTSRAGR